MFSNKSYAKIKEIVETKENTTVCKITISKKDKKTNAYETSFIGKVSFCGQAHLQKPMADQRIKITSCGVQNCYTKDNKLEFYKAPRYVIFGYELQADKQTENQTPALYSMDDDDGLIPF